MPKIIIDKEKCKACKICIDACPKKLIGISEDTNKSGCNYAIFNDKNNECIGCAICATCCPDIAIKEVYK